MNTVEKYGEYVNTSMVAGVMPVVFDHAEGAIVFAEDGRQYLDCFAGISTISAGYSNPRVIKAARAQMDKYVHCASFVYYNKPMADLAEKLARITPGKLKKSFFGNSGAEANEGAMRLAKTFTGRREFVALQASFHGRTYATLSLTGNAACKKRAGPYMPGVSFAPAPYCYRCPFNIKPEKCGMLCAENLSQTLQLGTYGDVAAFVIEPVMGEGGIIPLPDGYLKAVKQVLEERKILLMVDEVQTGFARTGKMFAIEPYGVEPDIMTMAKGIANGFPLSAFIAPDEIAGSFQPGEHLTTFGGNAVSCAAALATIDFLEKEKIADKALANGKMVMKRLDALKAKLPVIGDVRGKGLMIGIELVKDKDKTPAREAAAAVRKSCIEKGLLIGVGGIFGNVLRLQPPLVISEEQLDQAVGIIRRALSGL